MSENKSWEYKNYEEYVECQIKRHKAKSYYHMTQRYYEEIFLKFEKYFTLDPKIQTIIAQGVRNDFEVDAISSINSGVEVYGTDINYENTYKNIFKLDFNKCPKGWNKKFDLLFSNSFDHTPAPDLTLKEWKRITKKYMLIHFQYSEEASWHDPLALTSFDEIENLCKKQDLDILFCEETEENSAMHHEGWLVLLKV
tara:strand:+ start:5502 stop:6092 length:591 start_codon:yes stop_codon:yes gene_type:complete